MISEFKTWEKWLMRVLVAALTVGIGFTSTGPDLPPGYVETLPAVFEVVEYVRFDKTSTQPSTIVHDPKTGKYYILANHDGHIAMVEIER